MSTDAFADAFSVFDEHAPDDLTITPPGPPPAEPPAEEVPPPETPAEPVFTSIDDMLAPPPDDVPPAPSAFNPLDTAVGPTPPAPPAQPPAPGKKHDGVPQEIRDQFMEKLTSGDPTDAFVYAAELGASAALQQMQQQLAGVKQTTLMGTVDSFKRKVAAADPKLFAAAQKDFDAMLGAAIDNLKKNPGAVANITEAQVEQACADFYDKAKARVLDRLLAGSRQPATPPATPPQVEPSAPPATPSYAPPSTPAPRNRAQGALVGRNAKETEFIEMSRAAGLTDAEIRDML